MGWLDVGEWSLKSAEKNWNGRWMWSKKGATEDKESKFVEKYGEHKQNQDDVPGWLFCFSAACVPETWVTPQSAPFPPDTPHNGWLMVKDESKAAT